MKSNDRSNTNQNKFPIFLPRNICQKRGQKRNTVETNTLVDLFKIDKREFEVSDELRRKEADKNQKSWKAMSVKNKSVHKKLFENRPKSVKIDEWKINFGDLVKNFALFVARMARSVMEYIFVYGTELIVQVMAVCTLSLVMLLKYVESLIKSRTLTMLIMRIESINLSHFHPRDLTFSISEMFRWAYRILWVLWKLLEFMVIVIKHIVFKLVVLAIFIVSFSVIQTIQFLTQMLFIPTLNKIMAVLNLDINRISSCANFQLKQAVLSVMFNTINILPHITYCVSLLGNFRYYILQIGEIKSNLMQLIFSVRLGFYSLKLVCNTFCTTLMEFASILAFVVLHVNYLFFMISSLINSIIAIFTFISLLGYYIRIISVCCASFNGFFTHAKIVLNNYQQ